jgi:integrase
MKNGKATPRAAPRAAGKSTRKHYANGLYLQTGEKGSASWLLRYQRNGAEHWMGLGPKSVFSLKEAKARARAAQQQIYDGVDPLQAKRKARAKEALDKSRSITFADAAQQYYVGHEKKWTSHKSRQAFRNTLEQYAYPVIGKWAVADVDTAAVLRIVEPIWAEKNQTASRIRGRIEAVLDWATVRGFRTGDNPGRWETLGKVLPSSGEIAPVKHHPALPYGELPAFVEQLSGHQGIGPKALEFIILTACRTSEVLLARWPEFDFENKIWTIPGPRMKKRKDKPHRVPLNSRMVALLEALPRESDKGLVFVGSKANTVIGKMTLPQLVDAMGHDVTIHGMRASFKSWASEQTSYPSEVIEFSLAHVVGSAAEQAYMRSDILEKRRLLMEAWSTFVGTPQRKTGNNVTPIRAKAGV